MSKDDRQGRKAIIGLSASGDEVLCFVWDKGKLIDQSTAPQHTRLLIFLDPEGEAATDRLWILPVLSNLTIDPTGAHCTLEGRVRSFLPETPVSAKVRGYQEFTLRFRASATPTALLDFVEMKIGHATRKATIPCREAELIAAKLSGKTLTIAPQPPKYVDRSLITLDPWSAGIPDQIKWEFSASFVPSRVTVQEDDTPDPHALHAKLILERSAELPLKPGAQQLSCFALSFQGDQLPARGNTFPYTVVRQRLPRENAWPIGSKDIRTERWLLSFTMPHVAVLQKWDADVVNPVRRALQLVQGGRPLTTFPNLRAPTVNKQEVWEAWFSFIDRSIEQTPDDDDYVPGPTIADGKVTIMPRVLTPFASRDQTVRSVPAVGTFRSLLRTSDPIAPKSTDGLRVTGLCHRVALEDELDYEVQPRPSLAFGFEQTQPADPIPNATAQTVRMGALDLSFLPTVPDGNPDKRMDLKTKRPGRLAASWPPTFHAGDIDERTVNLTLGVSAVEPGGQDDLPGDEYIEDLPSIVVSENSAEEMALRQRHRRRPPLVFSRNSAAITEWTPRYRLAVHEGVQRALSQTIVIELHELSLTGKGSERVFVLDSQPWFVGAIEAPPLSAGTGAAESTEVANWSNRASVGAGWEVRADQREFTLALPPQTVGEAMHRRREDNDVTPGVPLDFRFGPPTYATLQPARTTQRFAEPGWNLRRLLELPPGPELRELTFELLYGIHGSVKNPELRIAEIGSRLGELPGLAASSLPWIASDADSDLYKQTWRLWAALRSTLLTRLGILEPWMVGRRELALNHADGLSFRLRDTARLQYPVARRPDDGTQPKLPEYFKPDGLKGGWSWGFESRNVLEAVTRDPNSFDATLTKPYLSAMGGWGEQRAVFDHGLSTIIARVEMGRVSTINIERLGRISVFGNRAKHVIVYNRTVAASRQFYLEQHPLVGNPVLRKTDEYIEILETERGFPEADTPVANRGFIVASLFPDGTPPRIRVNSRWGNDIENSGWRVPLWVRGAAPADVYPKPIHALLMAGAESAEHVAVLLDDPDKVYFYTRTDGQFGNDVNRWPPVEHTDFERIDPQSLTPPPSKSTNPASFGVEDSAVGTGLSAFTFRLQPAPAAVNYTAGRTDTIVGAIPRSVTVMRGAPSATAPPPVVSPDEKDLRDMRGHVENAFAKFVNRVPSTIWDRDAFDQGVEAFKAEVQKATASYKRVIKILEQKGDPCAQLKGYARKQIDLFRKQIVLEATSVLRGLDARFRVVAQDVFNDTPAQLLRAKLKEALADTLDGVNGARSGLRSIRGLPGETLIRLDQLADEIRQLNVTVGAAFDAASSSILQLQEWTTIADPKKKAEEIEKARRILAQDLPRAAEGFLRRGGVDERLTEVVRIWLGALLAHATTELDTRRFQCEGIRRAILQKLETLPRNEVITELRRAADAAFAALLTLLETIDTEWRDLFESGDGEVEWPIERTLRDIADTVAAVIDDSTWTTWASFENKLDTKISPVLDAIEDKLDGLLTETLDTDQFASIAEKVCGSIRADLKALDAWIGNAFNTDALEGLRHLIGRVSPDAIWRELDDMLTQMIARVQGFVARARINLPELPPLNPGQIADPVVRLLRSFGDVPSLPNLEFELPDVKFPQLGYYFFNPDLAGALSTIKLSPISAFANRLGEYLNGIDVTLPTTGLFDRLVPAELTNFDLSDVFPNIAGIRLDGLFRNLRMPSMANDHVRVTHGHDEATRSAWMQADVDVQYQNPITALDVAGVRVSLRRARFRATARVEVKLGEQPRHRKQGSLYGDWEISAGGFPVVELYDSTLRFDDGGRIEFDINPAKVRLKPPLDFLSSILAPFSSRGGFQISVTPTGVRTSLVLPIPNTQAGTFGIANLTLGFLFELRLIPQFCLTAALAVGHESRPFTLTVFILGGAGYLRFGVTYVPKTGQLSTVLSVAIYASASLAISLGPISGGVYAYFGIAVNYRASNRGGGSLRITLRLLFVGEVCLLGFLSVGLSLGLEAAYEGNRLIGYGFVSYTIKIGWFITIKVRASVTYEFGRSKPQTNSSQQIQTAADQYVDMF